MNETILPFQFHDKPVRVVRHEDGTPWFAAKDVFACLDLAWTGNQSLAKIPDRWKMSQEFPDSSGRNQAMICINEPALYKLAFRSNKPEAERFTDWVAETVLPQIRATGAYRHASDPRQDDCVHLPKDDFIKRIPTTRKGIENLAAALKMDTSPKFIDWLWAYALFGQDPHEYFHEQHKSAMIAETQAADGEIDIRIGATQTEVEQLLGKPDKVIKSGKKKKLSYHHEEIHVLFEDDRVVDVMFK